MCRISCKRFSCGCCASTITPFSVCRCGRWMIVARLTILFLGALNMPTQSAHASSGSVHYRTVNIDGLEIFYREAGNASLPTILLLHGFPTSSHMFRDLIPLLADRYHLI